MKSKTRTPRKGDRVLSETADNPGRINSASKGYAYVDFRTEQERSDAVWQRGAPAYGFEPWLLSELTFVSAKTICGRRRRSVSTWRTPF